MLPKAWRRIDNKIYLYKGSTNIFKVANTGFEPYNEYLSHQLATKLNFNHVAYDLDKWKNEISSVCPLFTSKQYLYVQIGDVVKSGGIEAVAKFMYLHGFYEDFVNMIVFDCLTMNTDRHFCNFGLLRDNITGKFISMAPIFDNGNCLLSLEMPQDLEEKDKVLEIINSKEKHLLLWYTI